MVEEVVSASDVDWTHNDNTFWQWKSSREPSVCLDVIPLFHRVTKLRVNRGSSQAEKGMAYRLTEECAGTHVMCPVTFQTVPCQQQTTAALRRKQCHTEMDRNTGAVSRLHLFILFSKLLENMTKIFLFFPNLSVRRLFVRNAFCDVGSVSVLTIRPCDI